MASAIVRDTDYTMARLHARRARLADGERLDAYCRIKTLGELVRQICPDLGQDTDSAAFQRHILTDYLAELRSLENGVPEAYVSFFEWQRFRFTLENLKVAARCAFAGKSDAYTAAHFILAQDEQAPRKIAAFKDINEFFSNFLAIVDSDVIRAGIESVAPLWSKNGSLFLLESAMEEAYLAELVRLAARCPDKEDGGPGSLAFCDASSFTVMLVLRAKWNYGLPDQTVRAIFKQGCCRACNDWPDRILAAGNLQKALETASSLLKLPSVPETISQMENACADRYYREANRLFRRGHMSIGAVAGFIGLRRTEVANLITLAEGLRLRMDAASIKKRMTPHSQTQTT